MSRSRRVGLWAALAIVLGAASARISAIERRPLPPLMFVSAEGTALTNEQLPHEGHWVMLYMESPCGACDSILKTFKEDDRSLAGRLVIVIGDHSGSTLAGVAGQYPDLTAAAWYGDPQRQVMHALEMSGAPVAIGVNGDRIVWSLSGTPGGVASVLSAVRSWVLKQ